MNAANRTAPDPSGDLDRSDPSDRAGLAGVASGATLNLVGVVVSAAATFGVTLLVAREFTSQVAGAFFAATSLFLIAEAMAGLGADSGAVYFIARLRALRADSQIPGVLREALVPVVFGSVVAGTAMVVFAAPLARVLLDGQHRSGVDPVVVTRGVRVLGAAVPFAALVDILLGMSRGYRNMRPTVVVDRIGRSVLQLLGVLVAALAGGSALLVPLWAVPYPPAAVIAGLWLRRVHRRHGGPGAPLTVMASVPESDERGSSGPPAVVAPPVGVIRGRGRPQSDVGGFWRFTAPRALASVAQTTIQRLDIVLVAVLRGPAEAAVYTAATRFLVVGQLGNAAISMAAQPQLVHLFAVRDRRAACSVYQATTAWLIALSWPLYLLAMIYGPQLLAVFGHSYRTGSTVIEILASAELLSTACGQVDVVLITTGRSSWSLMNGLMALAVNVGVDLVLIPTYGITGAAIGWAAAITVANLVPLAQVATVVKVHPFGRGAALAAALTIVSFCAVPLGMRLCAGSGAVVTGIAVVAGGAIMAAGSWRFRRALQLGAVSAVADTGRRHAVVPGRRDG